MCLLGRPDGGGETGVEDGGGERGGGLPLGMLVQGSDGPSKHVRCEPKMAEGRPVYRDAHKPRIILSPRAADRRVAF